MICHSSLQTEEFWPSVVKEQKSIAQASYRTELLHPSWRHRRAHRGNSNCMQHIGSASNAAFWIAIASNPIPRMSTFTIWFRRVLGVLHSTGLSDQNKTYYSIISTIINHFTPPVYIYDLSPDGHRKNGSELRWRRRCWSTATCLRSDWVACYWREH